jgi:hypothetical protein
VADNILAAAPKAHLVRLAPARVARDETGDVQYLLDEIAVILEEDPDYVEALGTGDGATHPARWNDDQDGRSRMSGDVSCTGFVGAGMWNPSLPPD